MTDIAFAPARKLASMIRNKKIGALELLDHYIARIEKYNSKLNAIIAADFDSARKRAKGADRALAKGKSWGPFHGVPITIKEAFDVAGMPTTWGAPEFKTNIAKTDAVAVQRWKAAGRYHFRQDQRARMARRRPKLQCDLRRHKQSMGLNAHARRVIGRFVRRACCRTYRHRDRQRHCIFDSQSLTRIFDLDSRGRVHPRGVAADWSEQFCSDSARSGRAQ